MAETGNRVAAAVAAFVLCFPHQCIEQDHGQEVYDLTTRQCRDMAGSPYVFFDEL